LFCHAIADLKRQVGKDCARLDPLQALDSDVSDGPAKGGGCCRSTRLRKLCCDGIGKGRCPGDEACEAEMP